MYPRAYQNIDQCTTVATQIARFMRPIWGLHVCWLIQDFWHSFCVWFRYIFQITSQVKNWLHLDFHLIQSMARRIHFTRKYICTFFGYWCEIWFVSLLIVFFNSKLVVWYIFWYFIIMWWLKLQILMPINQKSIVIYKYRWSQLLHLTPSLPIETSNTVQRYWQFVR